MAIVCATENLLLREFDVGDAESLFRIYSNRETMRFLGDPPAAIEEERNNIRNHIESCYKKLGFGLWGVMLKREAKLIGRCGILIQDVDGERRPEISYLIDREHRGYGFATEAALGVIHTAKEKYGFEEMIAVIANGNHGSVRVAEKCGFEFEKNLQSFKDFGQVSVYSRSI